MTENLKTDSYMKLLEDTGKEVRSLKRLALAALSISILAVALGLFCAYTLATPPAAPKETQTIELSRLQMAQILSAIEHSRLKPPMGNPPAIKGTSNEASMIDAINRLYEEE